VWVFEPTPPRSAWQRWGRNLLLFALTIAAVFLTGEQTLAIPGGTVAPSSVVSSPGVRLALGLLSILLAHEMGHYLACRWYRVDATLPFFIPLPFLSMVGTLGAFIRIRSRIPDRRALFDIGVAGPLAGFALCLPVLWLGVREATAVPIDAETARSSFLGFTGFLGEPLLFQWAARWFHRPTPDGMTLTLGPLGLAAWFGLFMTGLNLMPIGQLDGGHLTYALLRRKARPISRIGSWVCVALIYFGLNWVVWAALVRVLGREHPPTHRDEAPLGRARVWVALLSLVVFIICFVPDPVVFSWQGFFRDTGLLRFLP
jgi:membrane-associated protease RseP (regulator of RpoE activity)